MRRIGRSLSRLPVATALIAGAALLAGSAASARLVGEGARESGGDEVAMAIPRMSPFGDDGAVAWPRPLAPSEAARIRRILSLQARGALELAARESDQLDTSSPVGRAMLGMVLADRHLGRFSRPDAAELRAWLNRWPDLPDAAAIHALLLSRLPRGAKPPPPPAFATLAGRGGARIPLSPPVPEETGPAERNLVRNAELDRSVGDAARHHGAPGVRRLLARTSGLSGGYASQLLGEAARVLFTQNQDEAAYDLAAEGVRGCARWPGRDCEPAAIAGFMAGLAAWRQNLPERAQPMFEAAWRSRLTTPSLRAAAAFWAARSHLRTREPGSRADAYQTWLRRAAGEPDTFYGLIARRGSGAGPGWGGRDGARETLAQADVDAVAATDEGLRAFALLQVEQPARAEAELRRLWPAIVDRPDMARATMLVADHAGLSELAAQLADVLQAADGRPREETRFRVPKLRPAGGFKVDPAMMFALARTESNFGMEAGSAAGALGIMQIMPETARFITAGPGHPSHTSGARLREMLADPATNLALGQSYLGYLAGLDSIDGNLIHVLASYNCGPARFAQWAGQVRSFGDPLLFIEAIPIDETRAYVPRVLTYTWLYARRLRLATPTLDELAGGDWPRWRPLSPGLPPPRLH